MRCAIVDDERIFSEKLGESVQNYFEPKGEETIIHCVDSYTLLNSLTEGGNYDLYLLDIEMPGIDGLELAAKVQTKDPEARIVFVTSHEKYALKSIKMGTYYYILKTEYRIELPIVLEKVWKEMTGKPEEYYDIQNGINHHQVRFSNIIYIEKKKKYSIFYCQDNIEYKERETMKNVYDNLPAGRFTLIDRGCIINLAYVGTITRDEVVLKNGKSLAISRGMSPHVREDYMKYWSERS